MPEAPTQQRVSPEDVAHINGDEESIRRLASTQRATRRPGDPDSLLDEVRHQAAQLRQAYESFMAETALEVDDPYAVEWLLDNFYVVQQAVRQIQQDMPPRYYRQLPKLAGADGAGVPRVYTIAHTIIDLCSGNLQLPTILQFLEAYQSETPLTMGEVWALPTMLRAGALDQLAAAIARVRGVEPDGRAPAATSARLLDTLPTHEVVGNAILSLRMLAAEDWEAFFEQVNRVEHILRTDPAGVYAGMEFETRDRYRKVVEDLAFGSGMGQTEVAREAVRMADRYLRQNGRTSERQIHVGYYLIDAGRRRLEEQVGFRASWGLRWRRWLLDHPTGIYLGGIAFLSVAVLLGLAFYGLRAGGSRTQLGGIVALGLVPATTIAISVVNWLVTHVLPPRPLPKLDFETGIPAEHRTMVIVPALLASSEEIRSLLRQLELHYLGNPDPHLSVALLTDFADAPERHMPEDQSLIAEAVKGIQSLNAHYARPGLAPFYLFHRERLWNPSEKTWMGWERKRGKLEEFNRLLLGEGETSFVVQVGDLDTLHAIRYVITLDADTMLPRDSARRLVGTLAHPLNQPRFDPETGRVDAGYTVLQPRTEIKPTSATQSWFARIFAGDVALDLYTRAVSDVYQDLFGEGIYVGKGIYHVAAFERSLAGRVPENALLSHDLFEGIHGRAGLVTDIVLFEDYPPSYLVYTRRLHRWIRGDWQLLPWLLGKVPTADGRRARNPLSVIDRWKIVDNLRRSLLSPVLMVLLIAAWFSLPGSALLWTLFAVLTPAVALLTGVASELIQRVRERKLAGPAPPLEMQVLRWLLGLVFLPYEALISVDAIATTLIRLAVTRRKLLQWTTAAHTVRLFGRERRVVLVWQQMGAVPILALALAVRLGILVGLRNFGALPLVGPLLVLWVVSPQVAIWISRPVRLPEPRPLTERQRNELRRVARRTWLYFEQFVGPDQNWLPPDHFQESPRGTAAHRTSPTNIGLMLLATLAAYDLGYVGPLGLNARLHNAFETLAELERYRGHFLNWYATHSLDPLPPRYVSTVDSGNLAASLLTLREACLNISGERVLRWERWQGLLDSVDVLDEVLASAGDPTADQHVALQRYLQDIRQEIVAVQESPAAWPGLLERLHEEMRPELDRRLVVLIRESSQAQDAATVNSLRAWAQRIHHHLFTMRRELHTLVPWAAALQDSPVLFEADQLPPAVAESWQALFETLTAVPTLGEIPGLCATARSQVAALQGGLDSGVRSNAQMAAAEAWCADLASALSDAQAEAQQLVDAFDDLAGQCEHYVQEMRFDFLFDARRQLFRIGYNVAAGQLDPNYYDLLASEARTASLLAVALGHVPESHWLHLGRPLTQVGTQRALLSWSGTMFEYLMPPLLLESFVNTVLDQSAHVAVRRQIDYANGRGVPWGISESGYYSFDADLNYQYRAFGVPGLGFKRGLEDDLVISPYSSLLALGIDPQAVMANMARFRNLGMLRDYGFYEAIDYTQSRLPAGENRAIVRSFMAHHQAMTLLSLVNYLRDMPMVRRFHSDLRIQSVELLLQEQVPRRAPLEQVPEEDLTTAQTEDVEVVTQPWSVPIRAPFPQAHWLSNGRYGVLITGAGGGFSQWNGTALTRWRADTTLDDWGTWLYLQDLDTHALWSVSWQPSPAEGQREVTFAPHSADFQCQARDIAAHLEISIAPQDDVEIRRLRLANGSDERRRLRITSYAEVVLAAQDADRRHPAFNKMFIESEYLPGLRALLFRRRPRSSDDAPYHLGHMLVANGVQLPPPGYETDRARFLGRGRSPRAPAALAPGGDRLAGTTGATLDPIMSLEQVIELEPHASVEVAFLTIAGETAEDVRDLAERYSDWSRVERSRGQARAQNATALRRLELTGADLERIQQLLSLLLFPHPALRADQEILAANRRGQEALWPSAISGDYPILLVRVSSEEHAPLVRELLRAHAYWRERQLKIDLVILNEAETGYDQNVQGRLHRVLHQTDSDDWLHRRGGIFLIRADQVSEADRVLLATAARVVLAGDRGTLAEQMDDILEHPNSLPAFAPSSTVDEVREPTPDLTRPDELVFDNGFGGFSPDGREYIIYLGGDEWTPAPWINVIANPDFGFLVSEASSGYSWAVNSGENRLSPWSNDPVRDTPGEAIYLRDEETAQVWSPTPLPAGDEKPYLVRHGAGYSVFEHHSQGLKQRVRTFAAPDAPVKLVQVRLENLWTRTRRITITYYAEWVLGVDRDAMQQYVIPEYDSEQQALLARNPYNAEFGDRVAFVAADRQPHGLTADRTEFLGRLGNLARPAALGRIGLANRVQPGLDPCAALQLHVDLEPGEAEEVVFIVGQGDNREAALALVRGFREPARVTAAWDTVRKAWDDILGTVSVDTPDTAMDILLNRWLLYQAVACRIWGRSALYQSSGAYGFRDQLQDVMAALHTAPDLARDQILRAARHQFEAGDVLHWWHPPSGRGVRTRIADDLLWLPFVTAYYIEVTGDRSILTEEMPFRVGEPLNPEEEERYGLYETTEAEYTLYEHCRRAIAAGTMSGPHDLPLIRAGDWNDGMNRVGIEGRGESIWLGWFLHATLTRFAAIAELMQDDAEAERYRNQAADLQRALEASGWDGEWYLRAYYDDGAPLGSSQNMECQIDAIAQSWAVLSGAGDPERTAEALQAVRRRLIRPEDRLLLLFTPPFNQTPRDPGYIKGYPPGIRENGGQYTHAAIWTVWAIAQMGDGDYAGELYRMLNPIYRADSRSKAEHYGVEPYVTAADVYSVLPHTGRGGWTWYTGSGGWMYRLGLEAILGVRRIGDSLRMEPSIPRDWPGYEIRYRYGDTTYQITVCNPAGVMRGVRRVALDGRELPDQTVPLTHDGQEHAVHVEMG